MVHQLIIYSRALATGSIRISIVYGVHSYRALKYAGKPWIRQCFESTISPNFFTAEVFYYTVAKMVASIAGINLHHIPSHLFHNHNVHIQIVNSIDNMIIITSCMCNSYRK